MAKILVAGELNPDMILHGCGAFPTPGKEVLAGDFAMVLGSASAICAMGLARLGNAVSFLSRIGTDLWGSFCLEILETRWGGYFERDSGPGAQNRRHRIHQFFEGSRAGDVSWGPSPNSMSKTSQTRLSRNSTICMCLPIICSSGSGLAAGGCLRVPEGWDSPPR